MASKRVFAKMKKEPKYSTRKRNRCQITGRARGVYRKFGVSVRHPSFLRHPSWDKADDRLFSAGARARRMEHSLSGPSPGQLSMSFRSARRIR